MVKNFVKDPKEVKTSKNKKKNRRKKEQQQKNSSLKEASEVNKVVVNILFCFFFNEKSQLFIILDVSVAFFFISRQEVNGQSIRHQSAEADRIAETSNSHTEDVFAHREFDDGDIDDGIDPALKEKIDRLGYILNACLVMLFQEK